MAIERKALVGEWRHSHEEDTEREMVFRPADHNLPPSRGRSGLDLRDDGSLVESVPGPTDRPEEGAGSWELDEGDVLVLNLAGAPVREARVLAVEPGRLVLDKRERPLAR